MIVKRIFYTKTLEFHSFTKTVLCVFDIKKTIKDDIFLPLIRGEVALNR